MKRITYMSHLARPLSDAEIEELGAVSSYKNRRDDISGVLIHFSGMFFQIIEGDDVKVTRLFEKICVDSRHTGIVCLKAEHEVEERLFPDWSMQVVNLERATDALMRPIRILLASLLESHGIIEKYTQPSVLGIINAGLNPLCVRPRRVEKIVFLSDMVSFSLLSERFALEEVADLVNRYLDVASRHLHRNGGEVTKFIGDSVLAYFAPGDADAALEAGLDILAEMAKLRDSARADDVRRLLYCGIGLSRGEVVEGNFGSSVKLDYTILGDSVNTAARLESLTRQVGKSLILSADVGRCLKRHWPLRKLGSLSLKGKKRPVAAYTLDHPLVDQMIGHEQIARRLRRRAAGPR